MESHDTDNTLKGDNGWNSNFYTLLPRLLIFVAHIPPIITMHAAEFHWYLSDTFWVMIFVFGNKDLHSKPISSHKF